MREKASSTRNFLAFSAAAIFLFSLAAGQGAAQTGSSGSGMAFSFKVSGGMGYLLDGAGDLENYRLGRQDRINAAADYGYDTTFNWKKLTMYPDFNAEIIFNLTKNLGIGLGAGMINANSEGNYSNSGTFSGEEWWGSWTETISDASTQKYKIQALSINLSLYFFLPLDDRQKMNIYGYAGGGFYLGKLTHDFAEDYEDYYEDESWYYLNMEEEYIWHEDVKETPKQNKIGFRGGLGFEFNITSSLYVGLEFYGRFVNFDNLIGDYSSSWSYSDKVWLEYFGLVLDETGSGTDKETGNLWLYETSSWGKDCAQMWIWEEKPSNGYENVKKAAINLNSAGVQFSIRFRFGL